MKRIFLLVFFTLVLFPHTLLADGWHRDLEQAKKLALSTDKLILVDFWASWCGPCKKMDQESWSTPEVQKLMENYIPLQIDIDRNRRDALKYGVRAIPFIFIIDGNGKVIYQSRGYMDKAEVEEVLKKYALNTSFLRRQAVGYYRHQNYVTALRLAERYLDYTLYLEGEVKQDFVNLAENYLEEAEELLDRKQDNYDFMKEKVELLELMASLYEEDERQVQKTIEKTEYDELDEKNRPLYAYVNLCLNQKQENLQEVEKWSQILKEGTRSEKYFVMADLYSQKSEQ